MRLWTGATRLARSASLGWAILFCAPHSAPAQTHFDGGLRGDTQAKALDKPQDISGYSRGCEGLLRTWADPRNAGKVTCAILYSPVCNPLLACQVPKAPEKFPTVAIRVARADLPLVHRRAQVIERILKDKGYVVVIEEKPGVH